MEEVPYYRLLTDDMFSYTLTFESSDPEVSRQMMVEKFLEERFTSIPAYDFKIVRPQAIRAWRMNGGTSAWVLNESGQKIREKDIEY